MTESRPPNFEQVGRQIHRSLTEKVLDKACSDPQWRQQLIDEPEVAMRESGFPEVRQILEAMQATKQAAEGTSDMAAAEVEGHSLGGFAVGDSPSGGGIDYGTMSGDFLPGSFTIGGPDQGHWTSCQVWTLYWS